MSQLNEVVKSAGVTEAVTEAMSDAERQSAGWNVRRPRPVPRQFLPYSSGPGNLYVAAAIGSGYCGNVGACGGGGMGGGAEGKEKKENIQCRVAYGGPKLPSAEPILLKANI